MYTPIGHFCLLEALHNSNANKKTGTNRLPFITNPASGLHVFDDRVTKL